MDVSIAVSLIRGQMGTVVERAVNGAVETVLAEMLKVVGVKFEELKSQVALMKRDMTVLQREKTLKEKENDNIRAKLRYTELKLKYYRQGVEEELQQRVSATTTTLAQVHPPSGQAPGQRGGTVLSNVETAPSCSGQTKTGTTSTSPQSSRHSARVHCQTDVCGASTDPSVILLPVSVSTASESLDSSTVLNKSASMRKTDERELEWTISLQPSTEEGTLPSIQVLTFESGQQSNTGSSSPEGSSRADSSTLLSFPPQVKQEPREDEEVICIKEELVEEQDTTAVFNSQVQEDHTELEATRNMVGWLEPQTGLRNLSAVGLSSGPNTYISQPTASMSSVSASPSRTTLRQPWSRRDLGLYEEYKKHRNELRQLSLNKRREIEKTLPQPLLSDLVRERREKTRLRVARWRAKRKLQACMNQAQTQGGAGSLSQAELSVDNQHQQRRATCDPGPGSQQRQSSALHLPNNLFCNMSTPGNIQPTLPFMVPSSSSSPLLLRGPSVGTHSGQHTVTSSSSYPQMNITQQSISLTDTEIIE